MKVSHSEGKHFNYVVAYLYLVAIIGMQNGKACEPEEIYAEMWKTGTDKLFILITQIIYKII